ncbi:MAG: WD40 repeat domain-containing protein [Euryarchaeota archaeon]|nr:WD40 repeat domain-containing protein [Euryarchaeota archaeon]
MNPMKSNYVSVILCTLFISLVIPSAAANSSGINFVGVTLADSNDAYTKSVALDAEHDLVASSYGKTLEFHDMDTLEIINSIDFVREIYDIQFSPNGEDIAISLRAEQSIPDSIQIMNLETGEIKPEKGRGNDRYGNIDWSPNSENIITPNMNNGADIYNTETMSIANQISGQHVSDVTCVKYSKSGNYIVTGDELGRVNIWDSLGEYQEISFEVQEEIIGCDFSQSDAKLAVVTVTGNLYTFSLSGSQLQSLDLGDSHEMKWSLNSDRIFILESDNSPELIVIDGSTFEQISSVRLMHKSLDFALIENQGVIMDLFVATDSNHIAAYGTPTLPEGFGSIGSDLDGDNIPDILDDDDDGDSHLDDWDFNCLNETVCSRTPDISTLRSYQINLVGDTLVIDDVYTMNTIDTYTFRNLSRRSIISDQRISYEETNLIEGAICHNMDKNDYITKLRSSIELSIGQINNGSLECRIIEGLSFTKWDDKGQIKFAFRTTFDIIPNASLPFTIEIVDQISVIGSSITHIVENHPVYITQVKLDGIVESSVWYNYGENPVLNYSTAEKSDNQIESILGKIVDNIALILAVVLACILSTWFLIRRNNLNSTILHEIDFGEDESDEEDEDEDIEHPEYVEEFDDILDDVLQTNKPEPIMTYTDDLDYEETNNMKIQEVNNPKKRAAFSLDDDSQSNDDSKVKRRSGKIDRNKQGPVMSTKRQRLDGKLDIPGEKIITKKRVAKPKQRKVRRVKSDDEL